MYIFILYGEVLSRLCRQAQESGLMTGIKLARHFMVHPNTTKLSVSSHSTRKVPQECAFWLILVVKIGKMVSPQFVERSLDIHEVSTLPI